MRAPSFYVYLQTKFAEKCPGDFKELPLNEVYSLFRRYKIPKQIQKVMLSEMEALRLIRLTENSIKVINCDFTQEEYQCLTRLTRRRKQINHMMSQGKIFFEF